MSKLTVITGPCVIESEAHTLECAQKLIEALAGLEIELIFKASYDKANRSSVDSFRGPGVEQGLSILQKVKDEFGCLVTTDVHTPEEATLAGSVVDVIQLPAFLCRQTDLLISAGKTGKTVNIKKGQFMAPWDMIHAVEKVRSTGNHSVVLTDRGTSLGYNNLVTDLRAIPIMKQFNVPVCFDASHSVQLPGGGKSSGGQREFIPTLAKGAIAAGADWLFIESHPNPAAAKSDAASVYPLDELRALIEQLLAIRNALCLDEKPVLSHCS